MFFVKFWFCVKIVSVYVLVFSTVYSLAVLLFVVELIWVDAFYFQIMLE